MSAPSSRLLRGYGPLLAFAIVFILMAALVPTVGEEIRTVQVAGPAGGSGPSADVPLPASSPSADAPGTPGASAGPARGPSDSAAAPAARRATTATTARAAAGSAAAPSRVGATPTTAPAAQAGGVRPCANRKTQVPSDPYSPPCYTFSGDNGGATYRGITADTITLSVRMAGLPDFSQAPSDSGPSSAFKVDPEEIKRTIVALSDYFNSRFQFYGRKLKVEFFEGSGDFVTEVQGGGQEQAEADAVKATEEVKTFIELAALSAPYADALARRGVLSIGAPHLSAEWMQARRPFAWSPLTDCTYIAQAVGDYINKRVAKKPARHAGGDLKDKPRRIAFISPENPWYQQCADSGEKVIKDAGNSVDARITYKFDLSTLSNQAASVIAKLRNENITSIVCGCDPAFPIFLTSKAQEQRYEPEWVILGAAFIDVDVIGQLYQQDQWSRAFGVSFLGPMQPLRATFGYNAFKVARPNEEPSALVDLLYYQMYLAVVGIQMAGPNLNPETYERGMFAYPGGSGLAGTWKFLPGRYTPTVDGREVYWDRNRVSVQNNEKGAYVETEPGKRYRPGDWPPGDPPVFPQ